MKAEAMFAGSTVPCTGIDREEPLNGQEENERDGKRMSYFCDR